MNEKKTQATSFIKWDNKARSGYSLGQIGQGTLVGKGRPIA